ncbi:hypothetical protein [Geodermatophilus sp. SYSU D01036]
MRAVARARRDRTLSTRRSSGLAPSLSWVAASVALSGVLTYAYLTVAARALPADGYAAFGAYWSLALVVSSGLFLPLELEVARTVHLRGGSMPPGTVRAVAALTTLALVAVAATAPLLARAVGGSPGLVVALAVVALVAPAQFLLRGVLLGRGRYRTHGVVLLADAVLRLAGALVVVALASPVTPAALGWTLVAAIGLAHVPVLVLALRTRGGVPAPGPGVALPAVGSLLVGTLCAQVLLNAAPVLVTVGAGPGGGMAAAAFVAAFTLVRLPLFVAVPLQSALIPGLVDAGAGVGSAARVRIVRRLLLAVAGLTAAAAAVGAVAGPPVVALVFGDRYTPSPADVGVLAAGSIVHLGLLVAGQAVVAAGRHRDSALSWVAGLVVASVVVAVVPGHTAAPAWAFAVGSAAALAWCAAVLVRTRPDTPPSAPVAAAAPEATS